MQFTEYKVHKNAFHTQVSELCTKKLRIKPHPIMQHSYDQLQNNFVFVFGDSQN